MSHPLGRVATYLHRARSLPANAELARAEASELQRELGEIRRQMAALSDELAVVKAASMKCAAGALRTDPEHIRVVFLIHNVGAWASIAGVVEAARADERFEVHVISIPKRFPGAHDFGGEDTVHRFLKKRGVPHWRFNFEDSYRGLEALFSLEPDVLFRQSQWDADVQPGYSTANLAFTRLCLVGYEVQNTIKNVPGGPGIKDNAVDSPFHRACWRVFAANDLAMDYAAKKSLLRGRQYVNLGHPKCDAIRAAAPVWPIGENDSAWRVVWSAHHSITKGWNDFGLFPQVWRDMVAWAEDAPDVQFVFSPHPGLRTQMATPSTAYLTREAVEEFELLWGRLPNTATIEEGDYTGLLQAADLMITDGVSMLYEFQILSKPVVFLEREGHMAFNRAGRTIAEGTHRVPDVAGARALSDRFQAGEDDPLVEAQARITAELFEARDAGAAIVDHIADALRA